MSAESGLDPGVLRTCSVGPKPEDAVLKAGLLAIGEALGKDGLLDFPRRKNGTPLLMRQGFFERLLRSEANLQDCASADCSAAETDVKKLGLKQLLAIRCAYLDYKPEGTSQVAKASFLALVDRCASTALAERLLEGQAIADAHKAILMRHAMLIYGATRERVTAGEGATDGTSGEATALTESEWWLLAVGGTRRYLHLPSCEVRGAPPEGPVYCYRSYTAPDPRDPKGKRVFRWQALLVSDPSRWTEDPLATEVKTQKKTRLTDAKDIKDGHLSKAAKASEPAAFSLFGDLDIEDLFDEFEDDRGGVSSENTSPSSKPPAKAMASPDIDDFFDDLLADSMFDDAGAAMTAAPPEAVAVSSAAPAAAEPESPSTPIAAADSEVPGGRVPAPELPARVVEAEPEEEAPPSDVAEAQLRSVLVKFYRERKSSDKLSNVAKIARKYSGDQVTELWSMLAQKYSLPPPEAVRWLSSTLGPFVTVQFPSGGEPSAARSALEKLQPAAAENGADVPGEGWNDQAFPEASFLEALEANDIDAISALAFRGCPSAAIRPRLWRALLGYSTVDEGQGIRDHREAYRELRTRALAEATAPPIEGEEASEAVAADGALRAEVEADARSVWRGEDFVARPEVVEAICNLVLTHARKKAYISGSCELAALFIYVMALDGAASALELQDAEADAYWCFSALMAEVQDSIATDAAIANQARRIFALLRAYDPPLAELVRGAGLSALPATRLGSVLCTRAGFHFRDCARLWDTMLADPRRFEFCDFLVVSMMLLSRGDLLELDNAGDLAETLLAAPKQVDSSTLLRSTYALCAFERRCPAGSRGAFPPRPASAASNEKGIDLEKAVDEAVAAAATKASEAASSLGSLWGKAWGAGKAAAGKAVEQAGEMMTEERMKRVKDLGSSTAQAVASAATAAGTSAASAAVAASAVAAAQLESLDAKLEAVGSSHVWEEESADQEGASAAVEADAAVDVERAADAAEPQPGAGAQVATPSLAPAAAGETATPEAVAAAAAAPIVAAAAVAAPMVAASEEEVPQLMEAPQLVEAPALVSAPDLIDEFDVP